MNRSRNSDDFIKEKYPKCIRNKAHAQEILNLICLNSQCKNKGLICSMCKTAQHGGHNVVPMKMVINKSDDLLRKKKESGQESQIRQKKTDHLLAKIEQAQIQNLYMLRHFVEQISGQIRKCEERLIKEYNQTKQEILHQFSKENELEAVLMDCSRPYEEISELNLSVIRLLTLVNTGKNQYSLDSKIEEKLKKYHELGASFKRNIQLIHDDTLTLLNDIFQQKMTLRPSTTMTDRNKVGEHLEKYTFSTVHKPKGITIFETKIAKQTDPNSGKIVFVNENIGERKQRIRFKLNSASSNVCFGVGLREVVKSKKYKFSPVPIGHGTFMVGVNSYTYCHNDEKQNQVKQGFILKPGDEVEVKISGDQLRFITTNQNKSVVMNLKLLKEEQWKQLAFCVCLSSNNDKVSIA